MALFTPGPIAGAISGSMGGTVFSHNRGGAYIRRRAIPTNPKTIYQDFIRAIVAGASMQWQNRTDVQKAAWSTWAATNPITNALGASVTLSGHQAYVQLNTRLVSHGLSGILVPPVGEAPEGPLTFDLTADIGPGGVEIAYTATPLAADVLLSVDAAVVNSAGITNVNNRWKRIGFTAAAAASPFDIAALVPVYFGTLAEGQILHVRGRALGTTTGLYSPPTTDRQVVVDTTA